ncbi:hypothetical protein CTI12_AA321170 [Artemisia annua]|uniref:Uncharacterized protein n=1 Tax=Artemisia annua TaxID=35608 RepID=A0A2U1N0M2_ARTAN|nr:hypothetical protein CTI12_AA321170 [Artemisia annua]
MGTDGTHQQSSQEESDSHSNLNQPAVYEMVADMEETKAVAFMHSEMEDSGKLHNSDQVKMAFHVDDKGDDNTCDEDDDMGDEDDDNDEDRDDEDKDIAKDGPSLMSLADTDVEDHDETELRDEYDDDMVDEEDDNYHEKGHGGVGKVQLEKNQVKAKSQMPVKIYKSDLIRTVYSDMDVGETVEEGRRSDFSHFETEHHFGDCAMRNKLDGFSRNQITLKVLQVWAKILCTVPDSPLILKYKPFCCDSVRRRILSALEQLGLESLHVDLLPLILLMQAYSLMDISWCVCNSKICDSTNCYKYSLTAPLKRSTRSCMSLTLRLRGEMDKLAMEEAGFRKYVGDEFLASNNTPIEMQVKAAFSMETIPEVERHQHRHLRDIMLLKRQTTDVIKDIMMSMELMRVLENANM